jgi:SNF2 family DNA or RNA helicase
MIMDGKQANIGPHVLTPGVQIPASINMFLRDYQRAGVEFLFRQYNNGIGGILGDDMGKFSLAIS